MSRIGQEINRVRALKGMTPKQLAKKLGVSEGYVLDIESGRKIISDDMIGKVSKALDFELGPIGLFASDDKLAQNSQETKVDRPTVKVPKSNLAQQPVQEVWDDAFGNILKTVPVYDYKMERLIDKKLLPIEANKVWGYPKEKVFYLNIEDSDMSGFRVCKGDLAFCILTNEIDSDGIYFIQYEGSKAVRQVKRLQADKLLLVSNSGKLVTEAVGSKAINVLGKLIKVEITL